MIEALVTNALIASLLLLGLWRLAVRIGDVSFIDAVWGGGMAVLALAAWWQVPEPGARAALIAAMHTEELD